MRSRVLECGGEDAAWAVARASCPCIRAWKAVPRTKAPSAAHSRSAVRSARPFGNQLAHLRDECVRHFHEGLGGVVEGSFVLGNGLLLGLALVMLQHITHT